MELDNASLPIPFYMICILQSLSDRAIIIKSKNSLHYTIITLQREKVFYPHFMVDSSYTFSKSLQFEVDLFLEISRLQLRKGTISNDSNSDRYLQWSPTMIKNGGHALLPMTLLQLCER